MRGQIMIVLLLIVSGIWAQEEIPVTPETTPIQSIFDYDTCVPPCWLGIIPGESTVEDVERMLDAHSNLIEPDSISKVGAFIGNRRAIDTDTGAIITGDYYFQMQTVDPVYRQMRIRSYIGILDRKVEIINILSYRESSLKQVLAHLGTPYIIRLDVIPDSEMAGFTLIYLNPRLRVNLSLSAELCRTQTLLDGMFVNSILYYSEPAAKKLLYYLDVPQPALTGYRFVEERDVPLETWEQWLSGEVDMSCEDAWAELTPPEIIPMTLTPETENQD